MSSRAKRAEPQRQRTRINLTIAPETKRRLDRSANAGRYLDRVLRVHERRCQESLELLQAAGWRDLDVYAAREALRALDLEAADTAAIATALRAGAAGAHCWGVQASEWVARVGSCAAQPAVAYALRDVVDEIDGGNLDIAAALAEPAAERAHGDG